MSQPPLPLDHHIFISKSDQIDSNRLLLGLSLHTSTAPSTRVYDHTKQTSSTFAYEPSLTLSLLFPATTTTVTEQGQKLTSKDDMTSFSHTVSIKREKEDLYQDATANNNLYDDDVSNYIGSLSGGGGGTRSTNKKKLRLNKQQSALLEDNFKLHATLNPKQREALARQLNLRPRQVEVWFQNRRARTKLKQTEMDCEFLKNCCEKLSEENEKLKKELQHLKKLQQVPFHNMHQFPPTNMLTSTYSCPSCHNNQQLLTPNNTANFSISSKKHFVFNPFTEAC